MGKEFSITRRQMISAGAVLPASVLLNGCGMIAPSTQLFIKSALLIPSAVGLVVNYVSTHFVDPLNEHLFNVAEAAQKNNVNKDMCKATEKLMGADFVKACLDSQIAIWPSYNEDVLDTSYFDLQITNHAQDKEHSGGNVVFAIQDMETGKFEDDDLWSEPFQLLPNETQTRRYGPYIGKQYSWGRKRIVVRSAPAQVSVADTNFVVLPYLIKKI